jgi:hypothetical protein
VNPTPTSVRADIHALLATPTLATVNGLYDYMAGGDVTGPVYIGIDHASIGPEEIETTVAIFSQGADGWREATLRLDLAVAEVTDRFEASGWDSPTWTRDVLDEIGLLVDHCTLKRGREDF